MSGSLGINSFGEPCVGQIKPFLNDWNLNHYEDGLLSQLRWLRCHFQLSSPFALSLGLLFQVVKANA